MTEPSKTVWSWVNQPEKRRPKADGVGRYSRPLSLRDQVVVTAFGQEVRRLRMKRDLSARDLAKIVGMSQPSIIHIETKCRVNVELRLMFDFAEALHVKPSHFLDVCEKAVLEAEQKHYET